ncbi:checkpoint protein HUS1 isoform X2 [Desmodus rotundus]|uniref:checkpoint protein HUS1 isoform X2 n=1 Tax=Desmodus rotundus TaxID=9430 RepID=UPI00238122A5|nr:checkpoint protein HUS1 isoform X2 [Desmodus rotundus]
MKFRAKIVDAACLNHFTRVSCMVAKLARACTLRIRPQKLNFILADTAAGGGVSMWCELPQENFFSEFQMEGVSEENNEIYVELTSENLFRALKTAQNARSLKVKLTNKHFPCLTVSVELVIPRKLWKNLQEPAVPDSDVSGARGCGSSRPKWRRRIPGFQRSLHSGFLREWHASVREPQERWESSALGDLHADPKQGCGGRGRPTRPVLALTGNCGRKALAGPRFCGQWGLRHRFGGHRRRLLSYHEGHVGAWAGPGEKLLQACWPWAIGSRDGARGPLASRPQLGGGAVTNVGWVPLGPAARLGSSSVSSAGGSPIRCWCKGCRDFLELLSRGERPGLGCVLQGHVSLRAQRASSCRASLAVLEPGVPPGPWLLS